MKKISIIIPCYNVENYIDRCIESLVHQTIGVDDLELIFVNDASTDHTMDHLNRYEKNYPDSIIVIDCEENHQQGAARNIGLSYASAPYVGYVDSDDWVEPDMFKQLYDKAQQYECDVVYCDYVRDKGDGSCVIDKEEKNSSIFVLDTDTMRSDFIALNDMGTMAWNKLYRRQMLIDHNFCFLEDIRYEDNFWVALISLYATRIVKLDMPLYHYFVNENSTVLKKDAPWQLDMLEVALIIWNMYEESGALAKYKEAVEYIFTRTYYWAGIKILANRFTVPPYEVFLDMLVTMQALIPDWTANHYIVDCSTEFPKLLMGLIGRVPSRQEFETIMNTATQLL